jgi:Tfp pilus assembly protein PilO
MLMDLIRYRKKVLIIIGILLVVNIFVLFTFTLPRASAVDSSIARALTASQELEQINLLHDKAKLTLDAMTSGKRDLAHFYNEILKTRQLRVPAILLERQVLADRFGVIPERVNYNTLGIQDQPIERFSMTFPLNGNYRSLRSFIDTLEKADSFFIIDDIELNGAATENGPLTMRISVSTFFYREIEKKERGDKR